MTRMSNSLHSSTSSSSKLSAFRARLRAGAASRARTEDVDSQITVATPSGRVNSSTEIGVSGEYGGGSVKPTSLFSLSDFDSSKEVKARVIPEFGVCGAVIGNGSQQFFCGKSTCSTASHRSATKVGKPGMIYIPSTGSTMRGWCKPMVDSSLLEPEMVSLLTSSAHPENLLTTIIERLQSDPMFMSADDARLILQGQNPNEFKTRMKIAMTPGKVKEEAKLLSTEFDSIVEKFTKVPLLELPTLPTGSIVGPDLARMQEGLEDLYSVLAEVSHLAQMTTEDSEDVRNIVNASLIKMESVVGTDPGIGGGDTGTFTSAWRGIEFVNNHVSSLHDFIVSESNKVMTYARGTTRVVERLKSDLDEWNDVFPRRIVERSGRYADDLFDCIDERIRQKIEALIDMEPTEEAATSNIAPNGIDGTGTDIGGNVGGGAVGAHDHQGVVNSSEDYFGQMSKLLEDLESLRTDVNFLKSVTTTGALKFEEMCDLEFESEADLRNYLDSCDRIAPLPDHLHQYYPDLWSALDYAATSVDGEERQPSDSQLARRQEAAKKAKFDNDITLSRWGTFRRSIPLALEPHNTPASKDPIMNPLPGMDKFSKWDYIGDGAPGRRQMIQDDYKSHMKTLKSSAKEVLSAKAHRDLKQMSDAFNSKASEQKQQFYEWIKETYEQECLAGSSAEAWAYVGGCIRAIFEDVRDARLIGRATDGLGNNALEARLMWAMGMGLMKFQEYCDVGFSAHTTCVSVRSKLNNHTRPSMSSFKNLEQKVKTQNGEIQKLMTMVTALKNSRGRGSGTGGGNGGAGSSSSGGTGTGGSSGNA